MEVRLWRPPRLVRSYQVHVCMALVHACGASSALPPWLSAVRVAPSVAVTRCLSKTCSHASVAVALHMHMAGLSIDRGVRS